MGRHDPSRKRRSHKWKVRRSLKIRIGTQPKQPEKVSSEKEPDEQRTITPNLKAMAPLLWASDYTPLLAKEQSELASLGLLESAVNLKAQAPQSTYMARGLVNDREKSDKRFMQQASDSAAQAVRAANQQSYPFSICARSVNFLMHRLAEKDWDDLLKQRQVTSRPTAVKLVKLMMKCRPQPDFPPSKFMSLFIFDQRYVKKGASRGKHRAAERVDASGDLVDLISMVIVNSVKVPIPASLGGGISIQPTPIRCKAPGLTPYPSQICSSRPSPAASGPLHTDL